MFEKKEILHLNYNSNFPLILLPNCGKIQSKSSKIVQRFARDSPGADDSRIEKSCLGLGTFR